MSEMDPEPPYSSKTGGWPHCGMYLGQSVIGERVKLGGIESIDQSISLANYRGNVPVYLQITDSIECFDYNLLTSTPSWINKITQTSS